MDLTIKPIFCGNKNCIGLDWYCYGKIPPRQIIIEDEWELPLDVVEKAIAGLISHETIEFLAIKLNPTVLENLHDLTGKRQKVSDYAGNTNGIVCKRRKKSHK